MTISNKKNGKDYKIIGIHGKNDYFITDMKPVDFHGAILHGAIGAPEKLQEISNGFWDYESLCCAAEKFQLEVITQMEMKIQKEHF